VRALTREDLDITFALISEQAMRSLIVAVQNTGIESFDEFGDLASIDAIFELLDLENTDHIIAGLLGAPIVHHLLSVVLLSDVWSDVAVQFINLLVSDNGFDFEISESLLVLDESLVVDGKVALEHLVQLVGVGYIVLGLLDDISPALVRALEEDFVLFGNTQMTIDHILDSEFLHTYVDRFLLSMEVKEIVASVLTDLIADQGFEIEV
jgi:hypothetical protein